MIVRRATIEDAKEIFAIEMECFSVPWSLDSIETELLNEDKKLYYVVEDANGVVGYAGAWLVYDEGQITNIAIRPSARRQGFGAKLTSALIEECFKRGMHEIFLEVRISNLSALSLYRKLGFTVKGMRKNYYSEPKEDAYIMSLIKEEVK
ncbi:ribosomal-protein-alanine N-acetyltransferase [Veillonella atypica]|uniref:ribosomal protein S18-alanine N-acetyltransferase n=1 Tax=Veillonella atypica TaxID=39777 RepID=UPI0009E10C28|nr:ribosomal protein S18-alanine N-acetyltransferase [Veillonella atypica]ARF99379.1 ribosomal-protein-alanine N-acetyltransferase [Veillonella atypica]